MINCNAGKNYLVFYPGGQAYRCQCHTEVPLGSIEDIESWISDVSLECSISDTCEKDYESEWNRASRLSDDGKVIDRGNQSCDPHNEIVTRIQLVGEEIRSPEDWCILFDRLAKRYKKCWHRIEGHDPSDFPGISRLVEKISFLGDQLYYVTDLSSRNTRLVDVLAKANIDCTHFTCILDPTSAGFDEIKFLGRMRLIKERGYSVCVIMPGKLTNLPLFDRFFGLVYGKCGIPMGVVPHAGDCLSDYAQSLLQEVMAKGNLHEEQQTKPEDIFEGI